MRISDSSLGMESAERKSFVQKTKMVSYQYTITGHEAYQRTAQQFDNLLKENDSEKETSEDKDNSDINNSLSNSFLEWKNGLSTRKALKTASVISKDTDLFNKFQQICLRYLMALFYPNRKIDSFGSDIFSTESSADLESNNSGFDISADNSLNSLYTLTRQEISFSQEYTESASFTATGKVITDDGREIDFNMNVAMSRSFSESTSVSIESIRKNMSFCDPLVINLHGDVAEISDMDFYFDIDNDGVDDLIRQLTTDSGYLALDKNNDGQINDGSELFGTSSGDGFKDLAAYDEDGNGWIDENDDVFDKLKIWCKSSTGENILYTLKEAGVGAICLQNSSTDISAGFNSQDVSAYIRKTGIFLYENGNVGTIQHVDMGKLA